MRAVSRAREAQKAGLLRPREMGQGGFAPARFRLLVYGEKVSSTLLVAYRGPIAGEDNETVGFLNPCLASCRAFTTEYRKCTGQLPKKTCWDQRTHPHRRKMHLALLLEYMKTGVLDSCRKDQKGKIQQPPATQPAAIPPAFQNPLMSFKKTC